MADDSKALIDQIIGSLKTLPMAKRIVLGLVALGVPLAFSFLLMQGSEPDFGLLFSQMREQDAAQVVEKLREQKIPFRLEAGGANIMVPVDRVYELRLQLASEGLPKGGGAGFELLDKMPMGSTGFVQRLNYVRALQGELARTIQDLDAVEAARVHIVMPKQSLFLEDKKETTASVLMRLSPGTRLSKQQISGISFLVARGVEGLDPANVTLVDVDGNVLSGGQTDSVENISSSQLEFKLAFERNLERRVQSMLSRVVGPDNVTVRVAAELDFRQVEETAEAFDPDGVVVRSEQRGKESSATPGPASAGTTEQQAQGPGARTLRENETTNFEISKTVRRVREPVGKPKKISVAVLLGTPKAAATGADAEKSPALGNEQINNQVKTLVMTAIGFNAERGDQVEIVRLPYDLSSAKEVAALEPAPSGSMGPSLWDTVIRYGSMALVGILVLLFFVRPLMRWATSGGGNMNEMIQLPKTVGELENELEGESGPEALAAGQTRQLPARNVEKEMLQEVAKEEPDRVVNVARNWLQEQS
jgi:flagellar M-ring protein FliF